MIKSKYPVGYAVLKLVAEGLQSNNYEDELVGYVVSKCYVMESVVRYLPDGDSCLFHKVVFPYKDIRSLRYIRNNYEYTGRDVKPGYQYNEPYPVDMVSEIYTSYDEARAEADAKNAEMLENVIYQVPARVKDYEFMPAYNDLRQECLEKISLCHVFELAIFERSKDMEITYNNVLGNPRRLTN